MTARRIAAIDVGTNSIHMIVAEARRGGYRVVDREKETVQLGLSSLDGQPLTAEAMQRGVESLARMAEIAARWEAKEIIAVATSAVREAPNRREFLRKAKQASGIDVRVISGEEEADYIWRAVRSAVDIDGSTALCLDIGGGSVELIIGTANEIYFTRSEPLGALRLAQRFALHDSPDKRSIEDCREYAGEHLRKLQKRVKSLGIDFGVGTSGTILALAAMRNGSDTDADGAGHGLRRLTRKEVAEAVVTLAALDNKGRCARFGFDDKRSSTIVAGAVVLDETMSAFGIESLLACPVGIREGVLAVHASELMTAPRSGSVRLESVLSLAERTECDMRHARHVARLATRIFDQTRELHGLSSSARELLEDAALLHESGLHVSDRGHHKHTYYLVRHADLRGFTEEQIAVIANVARYYRKSAPDETHRNIAELRPAQRATVEKLAAILRIAEGLDRGHRQRVRDVAVRGGEDGPLQFVVRARTDAGVEISSASKRARYFASKFGKNVRFSTA